MKKIVSMIMAVFLLLSICVSSTAEAPDQHWANEAIVGLQNMGIIHKIDGDFDPDAFITRADFLNLLIGAVISPEVTGIKGGLFVSAESITRSGAVGIIVAALKLNRDNAPDFNFADEQLIYDKQAVYSLCAAGLIIGYPDNQFKPQNMLTYAETAVIIKRITDKIQNQEELKLEIERKFLVDRGNIPFYLEEADRYEIVQSYINFSPEVRIRKVRYYYTFAVKLPKDEIGLSRQEVEFFINADEYEYLFEKRQAEPIYKTRYQFTYGGRMTGVDIYSGDLEGLCVAEIEFKNVEEANAFVPFDWFIKDVTSDKRYKNANLAKDRMPED